MKRWASVALGILISATPLVAPPVASAACREDVYVEAYEVELHARRDVYRFGEHAVFDVSVTRLDSGTPQAGAMVAVILVKSKKSYPMGWGKTDVAGDVVARIPLKRSQLRPGRQTAYGFAWRRSVDAVCVGVVEYGEKTERNAFRLKN